MFFVFCPLCTVEVIIAENTTQHYLIHNNCYTTDKYDAT